MQDYRQIKAWQRGHAVAIVIHKLAASFGRNGFPTLRSQLSRAADSVPSNIVEGCRTDSALQFARYLQDSINSANEVEWRLQVARDLDLLTQKQWVALSSEIVEIRKMTYGYRKKVLGNMDSPPPDPSPPQPRKRERQKPSRDLDAEK